MPPRRRSTGSCGAARNARSIAGSCVASSISILRSYWAARRRDSGRRRDSAGRGALDARSCARRLPARRRVPRAADAVRLAVDEAFHAVAVHRRAEVGRPLARRRPSRPPAAAPARPGVQLALPVLPRALMVARGNRLRLRGREVPERSSDDRIALPRLRARAALRAALGGTRLRVCAFALCLGPALWLGAFTTHHSYVWRIGTYFHDRMFTYGLWALGAFAIGVGVLPAFASLAWLFGARFRFADERALGALLIASVVSFGLYTAVKASYLSTV